MDALLLKLSLTPVLILAISLASRRWGETVGGWLIGLPITSGPVVFFLALDHGPVFAGEAAAGSLAGAFAQTCFCATYFQACALAAWPVAFMLATIAFLVAAAIVKLVSLPLALSYGLALAALTLALRISPRAASRARPAILPLWDIPARMLVATSLVVGITTSAPVLGASMSGLVSTFPVFATVLTVFAHRSLGSPAARQLLRGLMMGLYCFSSFFFVLGLLLPRASLGTAFGGATLAALAIHAMAFGVISKQGRATASIAGKPPA